MKRTIIFIILSLLVISAGTVTILAQEGDDRDEETFIIVYDEAHYQYFTHELMSTALGSLNDSLDTEEIDVTIELVIQTDAFNSTNLQGADLVLITNPGLQDDGQQPDIEDREDTALRNLMDIGGSVLWMSNPLSNDRNITGHPEPLDQMIFAGFDATPNSANDLNSTIIKDDLNFVKNNTFVKLDGNNIELETLRTEVNNITVGTGAEFIYYGSHLELIAARGNNFGNVSGSAYVQNLDFEISQFQSQTDVPIWMFGEEISEGRAMLVGSTVMFSDYEYEADNPWVNQGNNLELFQNMIAWLLGITPLPVGQDIVTQPFAFFLRTNIVLATLISGALALLVILTFIYQGRLRANEILDVFIEDGSSDKKKAKKSDTKQLKSKRKKPKRRKRT